MIKIDKDKYPPEVRYVNGKMKGLLKWKVMENKVLADFRKNPTPFNQGKYVFPALPCYQEFRTELEKIQGPKCCFCEKPIAGGQIEHFRPKAAWKQADGGNLNRPGYFWLAYRWSNMLISCSDCNHSGQKGSLFPVNGTRATITNSNCKAELNVIINPCEEDPALYISFNEDVPTGIDAQGRGVSNIKIFKLKTRGDIKSIRKDRFDKFKLLSDLPSLGLAIKPEKLREAKIFLSKAQKKKEPFAGMIRENIKKGYL